MKLKAVIAGLFVASLSIVSLVLIPRMMVVPAEFRAVTTPADVGLDYEDFQVSPEDQALQLAGWWMPAEEARAVMVFIHGKGSHRASEFFGSLEFYRTMVEQGVSVAAIDLRNHGHSDIDDTGVQWGRTEKYDALAAIDWAKAKNGSLPVYAMGISMGGATLVYAMAERADVDGLILLDPLLDNHSAITGGGWINTGMPSWLFAPSAWSASRFFGIPVGSEQALQVATELELPILLMQDPQDPVTKVRFARELAGNNDSVNLWVAPDTSPDHPDLESKGRWGTHVAAFILYPEQVLAQLMSFMKLGELKPALAGPGSK